MNKTRLEAFSDGVLAILITIMVLDLKVPHTADWHSLAELCPMFSCYFLSFLFTGIYWGNHHHLLHIVKHVNSHIILANLNLLFWLSLIPFATGWMGENDFSGDPVIAYGVLLLICGISFTILQKIIGKTHTFDEQMQQAFKKVYKKGVFSVFAYSTAILIAFVYPVISCYIYLLVAIVWLIPDRSIEKAAR